MRLDGRFFSLFGRFEGSPYDLPSLSPNFIISNKNDAAPTFFVETGGLYIFIAIFALSFFFYFFEHNIII